MIPLNLDTVVKGVRYCLLNSGSTANMHVSKVASCAGLIYLQDKSKSCVSIVDSTGKLRVTIRNVQAFNIFQNYIYTYQSKKGLLSIYSKYGSLLKETRIGFRGVDFANLNDSVLVFHTAGVLTADRESNHYELALVSTTGKLLGFALPVPESRKAINYTAPGRFSYDQSKLLFISALNNTQYEVSSKGIKARLNFDFGKFNLDDSTFTRFKDLEDYHFVPFVIDITNQFNTTNSSFYSFSVTGKEGYLLLNKNDFSIRFSGLSNQVSIKTDFNNTIPLAYDNGELICIVERQEFMNNYKLINSKHELWKKSNLGKLDLNKIERNTSPVLMFLKTNL